MSARVLLMNSKKSLLSGSLWHNHLTKLWIEVPNIATRPPGNDSSQAPKEKLPRWWSEVLSRVEVRTAAYVLTKPLLCLSSTTYSTIFYFTLYLQHCSSFVLTHRHLWPFSLLARSTTYPAWAISDDHVPSFHRWWWAIWSCTILNKPIKNPLLNKNDLSILHRLGLVGACEH